MKLRWEIHSFDELSNTNLYAILQLRSAVFVVEQHCPYQDTDDKDQLSFHITGWEGDRLLAYCRVLPPGLSFEEASIGRVLVAGPARGSGNGRNLMELAVRFSLEQFQCTRITIGAQLYLEEFYSSLGFAKISDTYLEDNIPHIKMQLTA